MQRFEVKLTPRQFEFALLVYKFPYATYRKLGELANVSTVEARRAVVRLQHRGVIRQKDGSYAVNLKTLKSPPLPNLRNRKPLPEETKRLLAPLIAELSQQPPE